MGALTESVLGVITAAFDSNAVLVWRTSGTAEVNAKFAVHGMAVTVTFTRTSEPEWQVGFEVLEEDRSLTKAIHSAIRIFGGVFQAVREFLEVRQPERLVITSKEEALGDLYELHLQRQDTLLAELGYAMQAPTRVAPLREFVITKRTPSAWRQ